MAHPTNGAHDGADHTDAWSERLDWRRGAAARLAALAAVFEDPILGSDLRRLSIDDPVAGPLVDAAIERARARAAAVHQLGAPRTHAEFWAAAEALDRCVLELGAALAGARTEAWWSHARLREVARAARSELPDPDVGAHPA